jgi:hypothetical protein
MGKLGVADGCGLGEDVGSDVGEAVGLFEGDGIRVGCAEGIGEGENGGWVTGAQATNTSESVVIKRRCFIKTFIAD